MQPREQRGDTAAGHILQAVALVGVFAVVLGMALSTDPGPTDNTGKLEQRDQVYERLANAIDLTSQWCCADDPSAASRLQDAILQAWAGDEASIEELLTPWFTDDPVQNVRLGMAWDPHSDDPLLHMETYETRPHDGETVGLQRWTKLAQRGPAHVVPRLENVTAGGGLDLHYVPVTKWWPYTEGPQGEHATWLRTGLEYTKTDRFTVKDGSVERDAHTELSGAPRPAIDLSFRELPWVRIYENPLIGPEDVDREYRQVLTKEALNAERAEKLDGVGEAYPQHRFAVNATVRGPGAVGEAARNGPYDEGETVELENVYRITVTVPPGWSDVEFTTRDGDAARENGWTNLTREELPGGGWEVSALLDLNATYTASYQDEPGTPPRFVLEAAEELQSTFYFHARPPAESEHPSLGFHEVSASLDSTTWRAHERDRIVVELPTDTGRVHRSVRTHVPTVVPDTGTGGTGVEMTLGATLLNGGETVNLGNFTWNAPEGTFRSGPSSADDIRTRAGVGEKDPENWGVTADGTTAWWEPELGGDTCNELDACSVAADFVVDGRNASQGSPWEPSRAVGLYDPDDVQPYLDWFVRSTRGVDGVRLDHQDTPGFALAHRTHHADAGAVEGGSLWHLSPSSDPLCTPEERQARDQAEAHRRDDTRHFDVGPREDGVAVVGDRVDLEDPCTVEDGFQPNMTVVARNGDEWDTDAVGKAGYQALDALPQDTFTEWRNGVAESTIASNESLEPGQTLNVSVDLDSLYGVFNEHGINEVTVRLHIQDPYNAWEQLPWYRVTVVKNGEPEVEEEPETFDCLQGTPGGGPVQPNCQPMSNPIEQPGKPTAPSQMWINVGTPGRLVPGTHAVVLEVSWETEVTHDGALVSVEQTGRLIAPTDVTLPGGDRGQPTLIEGLAWLEDWR